MIKTKKGVTKIRGKGYEILADYSSITRSLFEDFKSIGSEETAKKALKKAFERGLMSHDDLIEELEKLLKREKSNNIDEGELDCNPENES